MAELKITTLMGLLFSGVATASYALVGHGHRHLHIRDSTAAVVTQVVTVPVNMFEYQGQIMPEAEVCQGIMNGTLHWAPGSQNTPNCSKIVAVSTGTMSKASDPANVAIVTVTKTVVPGFSPISSPLIPIVTVTITITPDSSSVTNAAINKPINANTATTLRSMKASMSVTSMNKSTSEHSTQTSSFGSVQTAEVSFTTSASTSEASAAAAASTQGSTNAFVQTNANTHLEFPDGEIDCSEFPDAYGAIHIPWMNLGGWTGIQFADISENVITGLSTGVVGNACSENEGSATTFCSYACPPGFQKSQWPSSQGNSSMAVSVGGLKCENGKLHLTNPELSTSLCIPGTGKSFVNNKLNGSASICRTDYPGTEDETVPLQTEAGNTYPLTCPNSSTYYQHLGAQTSAEYYVNNKNVPVDIACQWGTDGSDEGNWAPVVIGAETDSSGATWLSIMTSRQNDPTNYKELDFSIELEGDFGGAACFYTQSDGVGYYCTTGKLDDFNPQQEGCKSFDPATGESVPGCTVQLFSGTATYNLVETA